MDSGLTINEIKEVWIQTYAYCGFSRSVNALKAFIKTLKMRKANGINNPIGPESTPREQSNDISFGAENQRHIFWREARVRFSTPEKLPDNANEIQKEFFNYYRNPECGQHPRYAGIRYTRIPALSNFYPFAQLADISPRPTLFIAGEKAHSKYFS